MGRPKKSGPTVYGPYYDEDRDEWTVIHVGTDRRRTVRRYSTEGAAAKAAEGLRQKIAARATLPLERLIEDYLGYLRTSRGLAESTIAARRKELNRFFVEIPALSLFTPEGARARYKALVQSGLAAATHREDLGTAKRFGAWLIEEGHLSENPCDGIKPEGKVNKGKPQLTLDESRRFAALALERARAGDQRALAALLLLLFGLRSGELLGLVARSVDDEGRLLRVFQSKTDAGKRAIEVPELLQPLLLALAEGKEPEARLFPYSSLWPWRVVKGLAEDAGVSLAISPHGLRGGHATLALEAGATAHLVAGMLGHTSPAITLAHYAKPGTIESQARRAALKLVQ
jgi:integrase/recombinase XerD